jgi:GlpG protein
VIGGMSGVLYGVFGFVWMQARFNRKYAYFIDEPTTWLMMIWFVLCTTGAGRDRSPTWPTRRG